MGCVTFTWTGPADEGEYEATMYYYYCDRCGSWDLRAKAVPTVIRVAEQLLAHGLKLFGVMREVKRWYVCLDCGHEGAYDDQHNPMERTLVDIPKEHRFLLL